jgi:hypothetical protein
VTVTVGVLDDVVTLDGVPEACAVTVAVIVVDADSVAVTLNDGVWVFCGVTDIVVIADRVIVRETVGVTVANTVIVAIEVDETPFDNDDVGDTCRLLLPV